MKILISNTSSKPIYEQIELQIQSQILIGDLLPGYVLPSMRALAKELHVSVITTKRAYEDLERDGFIVSIVGKGSFVATKDKAQIRKAHLARIKNAMLETIDDAISVGISQDELGVLWNKVKKGSAGRGRSRSQQLE